MHDMNIQVLLVSSHLSVARLISRMCASIDYPAVTIVPNADAMVKSLCETSYDIVIIDENIDVAEPSIVLQQVHSSRGGHNSRILFLTTAMTKSGVIKAAKAGVDAILLKPFSADDLKTKLTFVRRRHQLAS